MLTRDNKNDVSKTLIVKKSDSYWLFTIIGHWESETRDDGKKDVISEKLHFHFLGE